MNNKFQIKLRNRILYTISIVFFCASVLFYLTSYYINKNYENNELKITNNELNNKIDNLFKITYEQNNKYLDLLIFDEGNKFYEILYSTNNKLKIKSNVFIFDKNRKLYLSDNEEEMSNIFLAYINLLMTKLDETKEDKQQYISFSINKENNQILIGKKSKHGYSIIRIKEKKLDDYFYSNHLYVLSDTKNHIISTNNKKIINSIYSFKYEDNKKINIGNQKYNSYISINNNINVINFIAERNFLNIKYISFIFFISFTIILISINYFSYKISKNTSKTLYNIMEEIKKIKNRKSKYIENINTDDEFEDLSNEINNLLKNIDELNYKNTNLIQLNKEIEIKQLESQFNPHFLYNTLETIRYVMFENTKIANDLILKLTSILRYSISKKDEIIKFIEDIGYTENYLQICKVRFQDRLNYTIKLDDQCKNIYIPKLILQPIIENSIKHNYRKKYSLSIWVTAEVISDNLMIEVEDNGDGISEENLKVMKKEMLENSKTSHIGINNVYRRLKLKYENFDFSIYSKEGIGTKIVITIPIEEK